MSSVAAPPPAPIPYAAKRFGIEISRVAELQRTVELLFRLAHTPAYQARVDVGAETAAIFDPGSHGVFMGYDFHLTDDGPRLIEINTNAGGALLNGLHSLLLCNRDAADWLCCDPPPVAEAERRLVETFHAEFAAAGRGAGGARLRRIAIADDEPRRQFLYPEFQMFVELFARHGIAARICDTAELRATPRGVALDGDDIDLVYLRDTDFGLTSPRARELRQAFLAGTVVVTPSPREHHLLADKRRLEIFSSSAALTGLGMSADDAAFLAAVVPKTMRLGDMTLDEAWATRRDWVFKPFAAYGSKAVYRGDKISRPRLAEIYADGGFLAQRRVEPGTTRIDTADGPRAMKYDVRAYAYRDRILLLGARVYQGQVTNLRTPGGGFLAVCIARDGSVGDDGYGRKIGD